jgi:hypothetical protein
MGVLTLSSFILIESPPFETDDQFRTAVESMLSEVYTRRPDWLNFSPGKRFVRGTNHFREFACYAGSCAGLMMQRAQRQGGLPRAIIFRADDEGTPKAFEIRDGTQSEFPPNELQQPDEPAARSPSSQSSNEPDAAPQPFCSPNGYTTVPFS